MCRRLIAANPDRMAGCPAAARLRRSAAATLRISTRSVWRFFTAIIIPAATIMPAAARSVRWSAWIAAGPPGLYGGLPGSLQPPGLYGGLPGSLQPPCSRESPQTPLHLSDVHWDEVVHLVKTLSFHSYGICSEGAGIPVPVFLKFRKLPADSDDLCQLIHAFERISLVFPLGQQFIQHLRIGRRCAVKEHDRPRMDPWNHLFQRFFPESADPTHTSLHKPDSRKSYDIPFSLPSLNSIRCTYPVAVDNIFSSSCRSFFHKDPQVWLVPDEMPLPLQSPTCQDG